MKVWALAHELQANDRLRFSFEEGSQSSPPDATPVEPTADEKRIDFFGPIPEEELARLESRPISNSGCYWTLSLDGKTKVTASPDSERQHISLSFLWHNRRPESIRVHASRSSLREIAKKDEGAELFLSRLKLGSQVDVVIGANMEAS